MAFPLNVRYREKSASLGIALGSVREQVKIESGGSCLKLVTNEFGLVRTGRCQKSGHHRRGREPWRLAGAAGCGAEHGSQVTLPGSWR